MERFRYEPITEPNIPPPILEPNVNLEPAEFALTRNQRLAIIERDNGKCQATVPHQHNYKHPLEVDHIIPQRYAEKIGLPDPDIPENLLTKCFNAHDLKHRDRITAREKWRESHNGSFQHMFEERGEKLEHGEIYWDDTYDRTDFVQAFKRTQIARSEGWVYPLSKKQKTAIV